MSRCRSCDAEIIWVRMASSGRSMPINSAPVTVVLETESGWVVRTAYTSHFATCPDAQMHRKGGRREE